LADAVCGAIFGAISHTIRDQNLEVDVHTFTERSKQVDRNQDGVIQYKPIPNDVKDYLDRLNLL
jgi:hypothetical protein